MHRIMWVNLLLVGLLSVPMLQECCLPALQSSVPSCPHHSSEPAKSTGTCPALDANATIGKQIEVGPIAFLNLASLPENTFIVPLRSLKVPFEPATTSRPPVPVYLHTFTPLI